VDPQTDFSRRRLLQGAGVAAVAAAPVLLAACGDEDSGSSDTDEANDLKIVQVGRTREQELAALYTQLLDLAPPAARPLVQEILAQEQEHVTGLATVIKDLGGTPGGEVKAPQTLSDPFPQAIATVVGAEQRARDAYIPEIPKLTIGDLRATWTSLATSAAQHISVLEGLPA